MESEFHQTPQIFILELATNVFYDVYDGETLEIIALLEDDNS